MGPLRGCPTARCGRAARISLRFRQTKSFQPCGSSLRLFLGRRANRARRIRATSGWTSARQPVAIYVAKVKLGRVLDLANEKTCRALGLGTRHLSGPWMLARQPVRTQLLGRAVSEQHSISAIRFPSDAARASGFTGFNLVIFRDAVRRPDFVRILGPTAKPLNQWP
jgi:hypothetical protein